jgi:23S rRNA pseudouridine1911/1915/1917 synthase
VKEPIRIEVGEDQAGQRLDVFLGSVSAIGSRSAAERLIEGARVRVDGVPRQKRYRVEAGQTVEARPEEPAPRGDVDAAPHEVVFEDDHVLVVDKPAGVVVHPAPGHPTGTLVEALAGRAAGGNDPYRPGIVHRLDRDTSGLLVVA